MIHSWFYVTLHFSALCITATYLIGGVLFNKLKGAKGKELIPHVTFWMLVPVYAKVGHEEIGHLEVKD